MVTKRIANRIVVRAVRCTGSKTLENVVEHGTGCNYEVGGPRSGEKVSS